MEECKILSYHVFILMRFCHFYQGKQLFLLPVCLPWWLYDYDFQVDSAIKLTCICEGRQNENGIVPSLWSINTPLFCVLFFQIETSVTSSLLPWMNLPFQIKASSEKKEFAPHRSEDLHLEGEQRWQSCSPWTSIGRCILWKGGII